MTAVSLLASVAKHELDLMSKVESAEADAHRLIEQAQADAVAKLQEERARVEGEIAARRRAAAEARDREQLAIERDAAARVAEIRTSSDDKRGAMVDEILQRVLPPGAQGGSR